MLNESQPDRKWSEKDLPKNLNMKTNFLLIDTKNLKKKTFS